MEWYHYLVLTILFLVNYTWGYVRGHRDGSEHTECFYHSVLRGNTLFTLPGDNEPVKIIKK